MRGGLVGALIVVTLVATTRLPLAQPLPMDPRKPTDSSSSSSSSSGTSMKVPVEDDTEVLSSERYGRTSDPAPTPIEKPIDPAHYLCGPGDVFELTFWGRQNFRLQIAADLEGNAFISKIGFVNVAGKSLSAVRGLVKKKVKNEYPGLGFELTLTRPRTFLVHVVDNIKTPGAITASAVERVGTVLTRAGGVANNASRRRISLKRTSGETLTVDLVLYELTGDTKYNPFVLDGDVIRVPFSEVMVNVTGAVNRPGAYELTGTKDLTELIELAGGLRSSVARTLPIRIVRRNDKLQDTVTELAFAGDATPNAPLRDDDTILVQDTSELQRTVLLIGAVVGADPLDQATSSKRLVFVEGDTVRSLIERAGGIKAPGDLVHSFISRPRLGESPLIIQIDLDALLVRRDFSHDVPVKMGDTLIIPPMRYAILVEGAVGRPGAYNFNPRFGVAEYVAHAGGRTRLARDEDEIRIVDAKGKTSEWDKNTVLQPGDAILVPERNFSRPEVVQIVIATAGVLLSGVAIAIAVSR